MQMAFLQRRNLRLLSCVTSVAAMQCATAWADINIKPPPGGWVTSPVEHVCGASDTCRTKLLEFKRTGIPNSDQPIWSVFRGEYGAGGTRGWNWTISEGFSLSGELAAQIYAPHVCDPVTNNDPPYLRGHADCAHGAELEMAFEPLEADLEKLGENEDFYWLQIYSHGNRYCGFSLQQFPLDGIDVATGEFGNRPYYNLSVSHFIDAPQAGCLTHGDHCPGAQCPGPCAWGVSFSTYIVAGTLTQDDNGNVLTSGSIRICDGVSWGFSAECIPVPEPSALALAGLGLVSSLIFLRRK